MIKDITDSMEKIGQKETTDSEKDVDKTSGRKSFVIAFKNLGRTIRTGMAKHGKAIIAIGTVLGVAALSIAGKKVADKVSSDANNPDKDAEKNLLKAIDASDNDKKGVVDRAKDFARNYSTKKFLKKNKTSDVYVLDIEK